MKFKFGRKYRPDIIIIGTSTNINTPVITATLHPEFQEYKSEFIKQMDKMFENFDWNIPIK